MQGDLSFLPLGAVKPKDSITVGETEIEDPGVVIKNND